ncbi:MAG: HDOD domain-containing protein [Pseudomonadota bacterium]
MDARVIAANANSLYSLPEVALRINELINAGDATNAELEEVILHDPTLTAKVLKIVNSSYFGFSQKIETVSRAIVLIGQKELRNLAIATSVASTFKGISPKLVNMEVFWYHSVTCGVITRLIAAHLNRKEQERFFIAGLLHGIGKLIFFSQFPRESERILRLENQSDEVVTEAEQEIFGFTYAELGAELLKQWQLPDNIWRMIAFQLDPFNDSSYKEDTCILHVAANIANCIEPCAIKAVNLDEIKPTYKIEAWNQLDLNPEITQTIMGETGLQIFEVLAIIKPEAVMIY